MLALPCLPSHACPPQVLSALKTNVPHNMETKKLLFGSIWR